LGSKKSNQIKNTNKQGGKTCAKNTTEEEIINARVVGINGVRITPRRHTSTIVRYAMSRNNPQSVWISPANARKKETGWTTFLPIMNGEWARVGLSKERIDRPTP
jgi:hypothetical protein